MKPFNHFLRAASFLAPICMQSFELADGFSGGSQDHGTTACSKNLCELWKMDPFGLIVFCAVGLFLLIVCIGSCVPACVYACCPTVGGCDDESPLLGP